MAWEPITTVAQLVARFENHSFDYKALYDTTNKATRYDIAKDVAAFATALGGTIVVGVREEKGRVVALPGVSRLPELTAEIATALQRFCAPIPGTPEEHAIVVSPTDALRLLAPGVPAPTSDVTLVTLNVPADPRGPIGVHPLDGSGKGPLVDTYRFPIRISDQTDFLGPAELAMWMNSHERRVALQLAKVPRDTEGRAVVEVHCRAGMQQQAMYYRPMALTRVSENGMYAVVEDKGLDLNTHVPFSFIVAVWEKEDKQWAVAVSGSFVTKSLDNQRPNHFVPYLGGA